MVHYKRVASTNPQGEAGYRYLKNNKFTNESRIPPEVMEKFEFTSDVDYDDTPERRRCLFCDAPQSRQRYFNGVSIDLCNYHYQNKRLGQIAQQVRLLKEQELKHGANTIAPTKRKRKQQRRLRKDPVALNYTG